MAMGESISIVLVKSKLRPTTQIRNRSACSEMVNLLTLMTGAELKNKNPSVGIHDKSRKPAELKD